MARRLGLLFLVLTALSPAGRSADEPNLAPNPGFEAGPGGHPEAWGFYSWSAAEGWWEDAVTRTGAHSLGLRGENGGWYATFPAEPGLAYSIRFFYRAEGSPANVILFVREVVEGRVTETILYKPERAQHPGERGAFEGGAYLGGADETGWVLFEGGDFAPREGVDTLDVLIKLEGGSPDSRLWLDDLAITAREPERIPRTDRRLVDLPDAAVWTDDVNLKILPNQPPPDGPADPSLRLAAAGGEYECFQVAITPTSPLSQVSWDWSDFSGPAAIPQAALTCRLVECISITRARSAIGRTGPQPDALTHRLPADLTPGVTQCFWFAVKAPREQLAGDYRTDLRLLVAGREVARLLVTLTVRGFSVPASSTLGTRSSFRYYLVLPREPGDPADVLDRYYRSFFEHRTRCAPAAQPRVSVRDGEVSLDLTDYLAHLRHLRDAYGLDRADIPSLWVDHDGTHRMPPDAAWQGLPIFGDASLADLNSAFERPFREYFRRLCRTLREEGLFLRPVVRFFDEPDLDDPATRNGLKALARLILEIDPELTVAIAASDPHPDLTGVIRQWALHTDAWYRSLPHIEAAREAGCEIHVYNNAVNSPDQRRLRVRLWPWLLWKYRVDGTYSWWGTVCWRDDMENPWTVGTGDFSGVLLYPPRSPDEHGPIESIRWELYREGLEDYEYLVLADRMASELEAAGKPATAQPLRDALAQATALVTRWPNVRTAADEPYALDPALLAAARDALAAAIEAALE